MAIRYHNVLTARCAPEIVWQAFRDVERWPEWNPVIAKASWNGAAPWQKGSALEIQIGGPHPATLHPEIEGVAPPNIVHWVGKQMGVKGEALFRFDPDPAGTKIECFQEFSGAATMLVPDRIKREVTAVFDRWLESLRNEAERLAGVGEATA